MTPLVEGRGSSATMWPPAAASSADAPGWSVACNVGRVREANEDGAVARAGVFLIADGMGGHDCGEIASGSH